MSLIMSPFIYGIELLVQCVFVVETGNQTDLFVISNALVITITPNIFNCNKFLTGVLVQIAVIRNS